MSQIPITAEDLDCFVTVGEFAQQITYAAGTINGIVKDFYSELDGGSVGAEGAEILAIVKSVDVPTIDHGENMTVGGDDYQVVNVRVENTGLTRLQLVRI